MNRADRQARQEASRLNGMIPDRCMPATQKQGMFKSIKESAKALGELRGRR